jgi:hypothetical protein
MAAGATFLATPPARADGPTSALDPVTDTLGARVTPLQPASGVMFLCSQPTLGPACPHRVAIPVSVERSRVDVFWKLQSEAEKAQAEAVQRWPRVLESHLYLLENVRAPMDAGIEPEPILEFQSKSELLSLLADLTDEPSLRRSSQNAIAIPHAERIRGVQAIVDLERQAARGTYLEIEEFQGNETGTGSTTAAMVAGGTLLGGALVIDAMVDDPDKGGRYLTPRPKFWYPGIRLKGQF